MAGCWKQGFKGSPRRTLEDSSSDSNVDYVGPDQETLEGNNISFQARDSSCDILAKSYVLSVLVQSLPKAKLNSFGLIL